MFYLTSDITIGNFRFSGAHEVQIKRSIHSYVDSATIKLPAKAQVSKKGQVVSSNTVTGKQFNDGDPVIIKLAYGDLPITEFKGFVVSRDLNIPLEIKCEGYSYQLKRNNVSGSWKSIKVADLLHHAIANTGINEVICTVDMTLVNIEQNNKTGADIIETIKRETDGTLSVFFIEPDVLWCGLVYTPAAQNKDVFALGKVKYRLGYNALRSNSLKQRMPQDDPGTYIYMKRQSNGKVITGESKAIPGAIKKTKLELNCIADAMTLDMLAQEHQYIDNYNGYEGNLTGFLQPYCTPGYMAFVADSNYPERDCWYLVEGVEISFGTSGARRKIDVGPFIEPA